MQHLNELCCHITFSSVIQIHLSSSLSGAHEVNVADSTGFSQIFLPLHSAGHSSGYLLQCLIYCRAAGAALQDTERNTHLWECLLYHAVLFYQLTMVKMEKKRYLSMPFEKFLKIMHQNQSLVLISHS